MDRVDSMKNICNSGKIVLVISLILVFILLAGCVGNSMGRNSSSFTATPAATSTPTEAPKKTLVVCVADEPQSLYLYGPLTSSSWSILESIYDGPIDTINYDPQPVILTEIPTMDNGQISITSTSVSAGDEVANTEGDIVTLEKGVRVFPEGCSEDSCAVEWDGQSELKVSQMSATFKLQEGLKWSDGQPLTAEDSVYSFTLAGDPATQVLKGLWAKTQSYTAVDAQTVQWVGKPGYLTLNSTAFFWLPLPKHQLSSIPASDLNTSDLTNRTPMGWGPYQLDEWIAGDHIRMVRNPNYFRAAEGFPKFDVVVYRFIQGGDDADLAALQNGECDVMDPSLDLENQIQPLQALNDQGKINLDINMGSNWEILNFGIKPVSYDDTYNPWLDRPDYFGDVRVRQAVAYCLDRQEINHQVTLDKSMIPTSYMPANSPFAVDGLSTYGYNPEQGKELLDEVGWMDNDGDPSTPRVSSGVFNILDGTPFEINLAASQGSIHQTTLDVIQQSLGECGIKVNPSLVTTEELFAAAPDGMVFGRNFDLVELGWTIGNQPPCFLYTTNEIPTADNSWLGTKFGGVNFTGYSNPEYDQACSSLLSAGLSREQFDQANQITQTILADDLPVIPMYYHLQILAARPDLCGLQLDISSRSVMNSIETLDISNTCNN